MAASPAVVSISAGVNLASVTHVAVAVCEAGVAPGDSADPCCASLHTVWKRRAYLTAAAAIVSVPRSINAHPTTICLRGSASEDASACAVARPSGTRGACRDICKHATACWIAGTYSARIAGSAIERSAADALPSPYHAPLAAVTDIAILAGRVTRTAAAPFIHYTVAVIVY